MSDDADARGVSGNLGQETTIVSVGIDVGSSTTHLTISRIVIGRLDSHFHRKPEILRREVFYQSPVIFTPFQPDGLIDSKAISDFVNQNYQLAGVSERAVDTGAVICTGEAAKRENAKAITDVLARDSGRFVCATAGHHFEAILAAHGSGSVQASYDVDGIVINLDIGGGTSKRSRIVHGEITETTAINIGARLMAFDDDDRIVRLEDAAKRIAADVQLDLSLGMTLDMFDQDILAKRMASLLMEFVGFAPLSETAKSLMLTEKPDDLPTRLLQLQRPVVVPKPFTLVCSGGVSEYIYGRSEAKTNDLGRALGRALQREIETRIRPEYLLHPHEGIRATVVGASQFTLQASGDTVFISHPDTLPISSLPVVSAVLDWSNIQVEAVTAAIRRGLELADHPDRYGVYLGGPRYFGYGVIPHVAKGIADAMAAESPMHEVVFVFAHNIANTCGQELKKHLPESMRFACIDEINLGPLNFLDIGVSPPGETYLPVIVKSLVFPSNKPGR